MTIKIELKPEDVAEAVAYWLTNAKGKPCTAKAVRVYGTQELRGFGPTERYESVIKCEATAEEEKDAD